MSKPFAATLISALLAGCALGPDFEKPAAPNTPRYTPEPMAETTVGSGVKGGEAQRFVLGGDVPAQWWDLFKSPALTTLIDESFKANPSITAAQAALRQAHEVLRAQQASFFPTVSASFNPTREKNPGQVAPTLTNNAPYFNLYTAQLQVSYVPDVFGVNRRTVESLDAQEAAEKFQLEATYLTLSSNVVAAAIEEASLEEQIRATEAIVAAETDALGVLHKQFDKGQVAGVDVAGQEAVLAQAQTALPPLQKQLAQQRDLLAALAGRLPGDAPAAHFDLAGFELPRDLPVTIPAKLVEQRPDIRAAEENLRAANANIGVAVANFFPNLSLTAGTGTVATMADQLFQPGNGFWAIGGNLTQTVFDAGALLHKRREADAAFDQAAAEYKSTVIQAFQNVADTLKALQYDADAVKANLAAERAAADNLTFVRRQVDLGAVNILALITAQQLYQQAVINLVQAKANRYADTAALFQALGGGWWHRDADQLAENGG